MKKRILWGIAIAALAGFSYGVHYALNALPIATGYSAKILCSCVFVSHRTDNSCVENDLSKFGYVTTKVDHDTKEVNASILGFIAKQKAVFRPGLGCTMNIKSTEGKSMAEPDITQNTLPINPENIAWPTGDLLPDSIYTAALDTIKLNTALDSAFAEPFKNALRRTRAVIVVYKGNIVTEKYAQGFNKNTPLLGWSMTKSVQNALVGIFVKKGILAIDHPAPITEWDTPNDQRKSITIDQLMRMSSGLDFEERYNGPCDATQMLFNRYSASNVAINKLLRNPPDSEWYYSSGTSNIIAKIIDETAQNYRSDYYSFAREELFNKIGMRSAIIEPDPSGHMVGSSYMYATARDWARFGLLYLNNGVWEGDTILPINWAKYSATPTPKSPQKKYGAHWWLNAGGRWANLPKDIYNASGYEGQHVIIIPSKDLVIVKLGLTDNREVWNIEKFIANILSAFPN